MKTKLVVDVLAIMMKTVSTFLSVQTGAHASSSVFYHTQTAPHPVLLQLVTEPNKCSRLSTYFHRPADVASN